MIKSSTGPPFSVRRKLSDTIKPVIYNTIKNVYPLLYAEKSGFTTS